MLRIKGAIREGLGASLLVGSTLLLLALWSFDLGDVAARAFPQNPVPRNALGHSGASLSLHLFDWIGVIASYALGFGLFAHGILWLRKREPGADPATARAASMPALAFTRPLGGLALLLAIATLEDQLWRDGAIGSGLVSGINPGGYWGSFLAETLPRSMPLGLEYGLLACAGMVGAVLWLDRDALSPAALTERAIRTAEASLANSELEGSAACTQGWRERRVAVKLAPFEAELGDALPKSESSGLGSQAIEPKNLYDPIDASEAALAAEADETALLPALPDAQDMAEPIDEEPDLEPEETAAPPTPAKKASPQKRGKRSQPKQLLLPGAFQDLRKPGERYALPPLEMLEPAPYVPTHTYEAEIRERAGLLAQALRDFKIDAQVVGVERGPNITRYELALAAGVKVVRIHGLQSDIQMALKARSVRIIAPIPGRSTIGIEVPNQKQDLVRLRELIEDADQDRKKMDIPLFLGKDATGRPLVGDLARMPHLLIAGATGSGKSVCMNTIIASILATRTPDEVKLLLIDPKMVELSLYAKIPHLLAPVVTDMRRAAAVLEWAVEKMESRYDLLSRAKVRKLSSFNALGKKKLAERMGLAGPDALLEHKVAWHLPKIVVVIDEFADLMCVARKEVEGSIIRLAQKSRAVGIHLILATQRPTANVITGLIKSNMPSRLAFQVSSKLDSRTILDQNGAESLIGQGDMLYLPPGTSNIVRSQGTYVSDEEVKALCDFVKAQMEPVYSEELTGKGGADPKKLSTDDLFDKAVRIVLESGRGSASLLQRRLEIGYSRASRLIDQMSDAEILGPFKGSKAREILVTLDEWDAIVAANR
ncbi:MAG: DNA translocase FtsK [Planctomycetota bacterium]